MPIFRRFWKRSRRDANELEHQASLVALRVRDEVTTRLLREHLASAAPTQTGLPHEPTTDTGQGQAFSR